METTGKDSAEDDFFKKIDFPNILVRHMSSGFGMVRTPESRDSWCQNPVFFLSAGWADDDARHMWIADSSHGFRFTQVVVLVMVVGVLLGLPAAAAAAAALHSSFFVPVLLSLQWWCGCW